MDPTTFDIFWIILCAGLVFLMQAGFLCLEAGLTRSKNNINVAVKNLADFAVSTILFWLFGFAIMFGGFDRLLPNLGADAWTAVFFLFQVMFCGTAVTILSGAVAERLNFAAYVFIAALVSGLVYPIFGSWAWAGLDVGLSLGWLGRMGFVDFAGSTVVHSVGGWAALAILLIIGPRNGRFTKDGSVQKLSGSNVPLAALGTLMLYVGWIGFNGGSTLAFNDQVAGIIANTIIAGSAGLATATLVGILLEGRPDVDFLLNGTLAGLVAITAGAHAVTTTSAFFIGAIGGIVMIGFDVALKNARIDDAVGAIPVHLGGGIWGTLAVGIFGQSDLLGTGLGWGSQIGVQFIGIAACAVWTFAVTYAITFAYNQLTKLRVTPQEEQIGLNISEHNASTDLIDFFMIMDQQAKTNDLSQRVPADPFTEVGQIATRYNHVLDSLEQARANTQALMQGAIDGIVMFSQLDETIVNLNPAAEAMFGRRELSIKNQPITLLFNKRAIQLNGKRLVLPFKLFLKRASESNETYEISGRRADGTTFPMEATFTETIADGRTLYVATFRDLSPIRQGGAPAPKAA